MSHSRRATALAILCIPALLLAGCRPQTTSAPAPEPQTTTQEAATAEQIAEADGDQEQATDNGAECAATTGQQALEENVGKIGLPFPAEPERPDNRWSMTSPTDTYEPCADLSWITVETERGTGHSPRQVMFFHDGVYAGHALEEAAGATMRVERSSDDLLRFSMCDHAEGKLTTCTPSVFFWNDEADRLEHYGPLPANVRTPVFEHPE